MAIFTRRDWLRALGLAAAPGLLKPARGQYKISVDVDRVVLHVTVQDRKGGFVSGLNLEEFLVYEDNVPQQIRYFQHEDVPVTAGMVVDNSGSMRPKVREVVMAALAFADSSNPEDEMFLVNFNEKVWMGLPEGVPFTSKRSELQGALATIRADGRTALYDAILAALDHLKEGTREKKVLIVVSDGGDNSSHSRFPDTMTAAERSDSMMYTIGLFDEDDPDRNPRVLKGLAHVTGGETFLPGNVNEVVGICQRIAHDIRNQYTLSYAPTNQKHDGTYRAIRVAVKSPEHRKLLVRARAGYRAPGPEETTRS